MSGFSGDDLGISTLELETLLMQLIAEIKVQTKHFELITDEENIEEEV